MEKLVDKIYFKGKREKLISELREQGISELTLGAMSKIPRHLFVSPRLFASSYLDKVLPISKKPNWRKPLDFWRDKSSLSQPRVIAKMTDRLKLESTDRVLEIGTATGYQAAVLSQLAGEVVTVDVFHDLCKAAKMRLDKLKIDNVNVLVADGSIHFTEEEMFNKIIVTASVPPTPRPHPLLKLLKPGGLAVMPLGGVAGEEFWCQMLSIRAVEDSFVIEEQEPGYTFVNLEGRGGWESFNRSMTHAFHGNFLEQLGGSTELSFD